MDPQAADLLRRCRPAASVWLAFVDDNSPTDLAVATPTTHATTLTGWPRQLSRAANPYGDITCGTQLGV